MTSKNFDPIGITCNFLYLNVDMSIHVFISCSYFFRVMTCIFFRINSYFGIFKNWHIFLAIHVILSYSCLRVVFIFLFVLCRVFCRVLIIFSCRVKFVFVSYLKLSGLILLLLLRYNSPVSHILVCIVDGF